MNRRMLRLRVLSYFNVAPSDLWESARRGTLRDHFVPLKSFNTMYPMRYSTCLLFAVTLLALSCMTVGRSALAQEPVPLTLQAALSLGIRNHPVILSKQNYLNAAEALTRNARNEYLPNVILSAQQSYGTINGQYGPLAAAGAPGIASGGPAYGEQNWNAAFGAAYLVGINWEVFSFGRTRSRIQLSE